jgi:hypothetical protein
MICKSSLFSLTAIMVHTLPSPNDNGVVGFVPIVTHTVHPMIGSLYAVEKKKVFIDGEAGTTGLQVRDRLAKRDDLEIISISDELRKDVGERKRLINEADCVILCEFFVCRSFLRATMSDE